MADWYCGISWWDDVTAWTSVTAYTVGALRRQPTTPTPPTLGNERVFLCTGAGTSGSSQPSWNLNKGGVTLDGTVTWLEVTGNETYKFSAPHRTLAKALQWCNPGDRLFFDVASPALLVSSDLTYASPGTATNPVYIYTVTGGPGATPPSSSHDHSNGGFITETTSAGHFTFTGFAYCHGMYFRGQGDSTKNVRFQGTTVGWHFVDCLFTSNGEMEIAPSLYGYVKLQRCGLSLGTASRIISLSNATLHCRDCSIGKSLLTPTSIFASNAANKTSTIIMEGGAIDSSTSPTLLNVTADTTQRLMIEHTDFVGVPTLLSSPLTTLDSKVTLINCDAGSTRLKFAQASPEGEIRTELTVVASPGATDGETPVSYKMTSSSVASRAVPLVSEPICFWRSSAGTGTVSIDVLTDGVTLTNEEAWLEVETRDTTLNDSMRTSHYTDSNANSSGTIFFTGAAAQETSSVTWNTTGITSPVKQKLSVTTTLNPGVIKARVVLAKPSTTLYYNPVALSGSDLQYQIGDRYVNESSGGGGGSSSCAKRAGGGGGLAA